MWGVLCREGSKNHKGQVSWTEGRALFFLTEPHLSSELDWSGDSSGLASRGQGPGPPIKPLLWGLNGSVQTLAVVGLSSWSRWEEP